MSFNESPLTAAKEILLIPAIASKLFTDWKPGKSCHSPFREDRSKSFSVYDGGRNWKDFGTGESGDALDFLARALGISSKDAIGRFVEMAGCRHRGKSLPRQQAPSVNATAAGFDSEDKKAKRAAWPNFVLPTKEDIQTIAKLRQLPPEGPTWADRDAALRMATVEGHQSWVVLSACKRNAQARRLDGQPFELDGQRLKAKTLPGSIASIPVGCFFDVRWSFVVVVEGGPDILAAYAAIHQLGLLDVVAVCGMLGAAMKIPPGALATLRGRRVRVFQHADRAGERAADGWAQQINNAGGKVDIWTPDHSGTDLNDCFRFPVEETAASLGEAFNFAMEGGI